ncbi:MAG: hypothetical protein KJO55_09890 [Gammaproteobacteria bacterium]|nr:hypothetical protein [Gammaproteobacteria bacterium]
MRSANDVEFQLRASLWRRRLLIAGAVLASAATVATGIRWSYALVIICVIVVLSLREWRRPQPLALAALGEHRWRVRFSDGRTQTGVADSGPGWLTTITFPSSAIPRVAVFADAFRETDHSRFCRMLRAGNTGRS